MDNNIDFVGIEDERSKGGRLFGFRSDKKLLHIIGGVWWVFLVINLLYGLFGFTPYFVASDYDVMIDRTVIVAVVVLVAFISLLLSDFTWVKKIPLVGAGGIKRVVGIIILAAIYIIILVIAIPTHSDEYKEAKAAYQAEQQAIHDAERAELEAAKEKEEAKRAEEEARKAAELEAAKRQEEEQRAAEEEAARKAEEQRIADEAAGLVVSNVQDKIGYTRAYNHIVDTENVIKDSNRYSTTNRYGEGAAEFIIYSDEYAGLFCAYWAALEKGCGREDEASRFEGSKLRWQDDFTNEDIKRRLIAAFNQGGADAFFQAYDDMYHDEIFPLINEKWQASK